MFQSSFCVQFLEDELENITQGLQQGPGIERHLTTEIKEHQFILYPNVLTFDQNKNFTFWAIK